MYDKFAFILLSLYLFFSCSPSQKTTVFNSNETTTQRISFNKTTSIKNIPEIVSTKGKAVEPISGRDLSKIIKSAAGRMHVFVFWTKECKDCLSQMQAITRFTNHSTTPNYQLVFVNINNKKDLTTYRDQLEHQGLTTRSFWLNESSSRNWQALLPESISTNQPYILAVQNDKGIFKHLKGMVSTEELYSFLQPLSI